MKTDIGDKKALSLWKVLVILLAAAVLTAAAVVAVIVGVAANKIVNPVKIVANTRPPELGLIHDAYEIELESGEKVLGWYIPAQQRDGEREDITESDTTVIFSHSYVSNKIMPEIGGLYYARSLVEGGYNVFMFDYSGSGISTGSGYTFGVREAQELDEVTDFVKNSIGSKNIVVQGWGYGAAAAIEAGTENANVSSVIADGSYAKLDYDVLGNALSEDIDVPDVLTSLLPLFIGGLEPVDVCSLDLEQTLKNAENKNYYFIQGQTSKFGNDCADILESYVTDKSCTAQTWTVSGANFYYGYIVQPENYVAAVLEFLDGIYG